MRFSVHTGVEFGPWFPHDRNRQRAVSDDPLTVQVAVGAPCRDPGAAASAQCPRARIVSPGSLETPPAHTQMLRDDLGPHEHVGLLAARDTWLLAVVLAAVRRMMTAH